MIKHQKFYWVYIIVIACMGVCRHFQKKPVVDEVVINETHISKVPCMGAVNAFFGKGVDSSGACICLLTKLYETVKRDPRLLQELTETGFIMSKGSLTDSMQALMAGCVKSHLIDPHHIIYLSGKYPEMFRKKLKGMMDAHPIFREMNTDTVSACLVKQLNGVITVEEYLSEDYMQVPRLKAIIQRCIAINNPI